MDLTGHLVQPKRERKRETTDLTQREREREPTDLTSHLAETTELTHHLVLHERERDKKEVRSLG